MGYDDRYRIDTCIFRYTLSGIWAEQEMIALTVMYLVAETIFHILDRTVGSLHH